MQLCTFKTPIASHAQIPQSTITVPATISAQHPLFGLSTRVTPLQTPLLLHPFHVCDLFVVLHFDITCTARRIVFLFLLQMYVLALSIRKSLLISCHVLLLFLLMAARYSICGVYLMAGLLHTSNAPPTRNNSAATTPTAPDRSQKQTVK